MGCQRLHSCISDLEPPYIPNKKGKVVFSHRIKLKGHLYELPNLFLQKSLVFDVTCPVPLKEIIMLRSLNTYIKY